MSDERWAIRQVNLATGLSAIPANAEAAGVYALLWWKEIPLGHLWLPREILPMSADELAREAARAIAPAVGDRLFSFGFRAALPVMGDNPARDQPPELASLIALSRPLERLALPPPAPPLPVSVIVCTRRRPDDLRRCLAALSRLDPPASEIVVVNNDPTDSATRQVAESFAGVRCIDESGAGLSRARNTGVRQATGEIVAWTDDDVVAHPQWIKAIRQVFSDPAIDATTGLVLAGALETAAQVRFERDFGGFNRGYRAMTYDPQFFADMKDRCVPAWMVGAGANMAFRRRVFEQHGLFEERLGAGAAGCSEDSEFWYRLLSAGCSIRYEPLAVVEHVHRMGDEAFGHQMEAYMRGHVTALLVQYEKYRHPGNLRRLFLTLPRYYLGVVSGRREGLERGTVGAEIRGCVAGVTRYAMDRLGVRRAKR